jgi:signal transduction histidine kinase
MRPDEAAAGRERAALAAERAELERLRDDFLATVSHELRTPLTLIRTSIGLLLDGDPDAAMRERLLRNVKQGTDRMQALVADLLDLARLRNLQVALNLRRVGLGELAHGAAALLAPLLAEKGQLLDVTVPDPAPAVLGDQRRLERVLVNLLANAHKFAPRGARVAITVAAERDGAIVAVSDTGPGIAPAAQARLWEQFYTGRTSSSSHDIGVGLGLPIARGIVEAHGGRIWVESVVGEGSTFRFALPAEPPRAEEAE